MNEYYKVLKNVLERGLPQTNKKGDIVYLLNERLSVDKAQLDLILSEHPIAKKKLKDELALYCIGVAEVSAYKERGIEWWDYCSPTMVNTYPKYFSKLPRLVAKINKEKRPSKNYVLFIGETGIETNQLPCLSLIQFQISEGQLFITVFQRSADCSLGLPSDLYQVSLIAKMIDIPLANITFFIGNAHLYKNNIEKTRALLNGEVVKFELNV